MRARRTGHRGRAAEAQTRWADKRGPLKLIAVLAIGIIAIALTAAVAMTVILGHGFFDGISGEEIARVTSPSEQVDAVLIETNAGATTSFGYAVILVPKGEVAERKDDAAYLYGATDNRGKYGVELRWISPSDLSIEYSKARQETLIRPVVLVGDERIQVSLRRKVTDPSLNSGMGARNARANDP